MYILDTNGEGVGGGYPLPRWVHVKVYDLVGGGELFLLYFC